MNLEPFVEWIIEREKIRIKKEREDPWPWTEDPILRQYRFCCVRRSDDRVTRWIVKNISEPYANHPALFWMLCAARTINHPPALKELIDKSAWPSREDDFRFWDLTDVLEARKARGEQVETGAYMIRAESDRKVSWFYWSKQRYVAEIVLGNLWLERDDWETVPAALQAKHEWLTDHRGWGPFMSFQVVVDLCFTDILANAPDRHTWAAAGPGTIQGLNYIHGRPPKKALSQAQALDELREIYPILLRESGVEFDWTDVMNICCEGAKYLRVKNGEGRPRALYKSQGLLT